MPPRRAPCRRSQRGATLLIALVMLLLVILFGATAIRSATMDERMAGNTRERERALQVAEAAVQSCLAGLLANTYTGPKLAPSAAGVAALWDDDANWANGNSIAVTTLDNDLAAQPRCLVEELGAGSGNYRVTGRAVGGSAQTVVMLQATYAN